MILKKYGTEVVKTMKFFIPIKTEASFYSASIMVSEIRYCIKHLHTLRRKYRLHPSQRIRANIAALETTKYTQDNI